MYILNPDLYCPNCKAENYSRRFTSTIVSLFFALILLVSILLFYYLFVVYRLLYRRFSIICILSHTTIPIHYFHFLKRSGNDCLICLNSVCYAYIADAFKVIVFNCCSF